MGCKFRAHLGEWSTVKSVRKFCFLYFKLVIFQCENVYFARTCLVLKTLNSKVRLSFFEKRYVIKVQKLG